jgi:hypothetical protein
MSDPVLVVVSIVGLTGWVGFLVAAWARTGGDHRWDRVFLGSAVLIAVSFAALLAYSWLATSR